MNIIALLTPVVCASVRPLTAGSTISVGSGIAQIPGTILIVHIVLIEGASVIPAGCLVLKFVNTVTYNY
jgi:hypothetical protein